MRWSEMGFRWIEEILRDDRTSVHIDYKSHNDDFVEVAKENSKNPLFSSGWLYIYLDIAQKTFS